MNVIAGAEAFLLEAAELLERLEESLLDLERAFNGKMAAESAVDAGAKIKRSGKVIAFDAAGALTETVKTKLNDPGFGRRVRRTRRPHGPRPGGPAYRP